MSIGDKVELPSGARLFVSEFVTTDSGVLCGLSLEKNGYSEHWFDLDVCKFVEESSDLVSLKALYNSKYEYFLASYYSGTYISELSYEEAIVAAKELK